MRGMELVLILLAFATVLGVFGISWIVAPVAKIALLLIPAIFMISLAVGFLSRRRSWF